MESTQQTKSALGQGLRGLLIGALALGLAGATSAASNDENQLRAKAGDDLRISQKATTGVASFIKFDTAYDLAGESVDDKAASFLLNHGSLFGLSTADDVALSLREGDRYGFTHLRYSQKYQGLAVFGSDLRFHFNSDEGLTAVGGVIIPGIQVSPNPAISSGEAAAQALAQLEEDSAAQGAGPLWATTPELLVYRKGLVQGLQGANHLAYQVTVENGHQIRELFFIDAHRGDVIDRFNLIHDALFRRLYEVNTGSEIWTEGDAFPGALDQWQQNEIVAAGHMYHFFNNIDGYVSYDNADAEMLTINNNPNINCPNANWNGQTANYCTGTAADDVVAHEWGHAYTEYTSGLIYAWQSGALNESYSDIWGETIDILNLYEDGDDDQSLRTACNSSDRWRMGEDASAFGGAIRDMWNPTCDGDPGKVSDSQYWCSTGDSGGVHFNSGVPNHLFALLVDGGTYNGQTVTGIGFTKAAHIEWRAQRLYLTNVGEFTDQADNLEAACADLIGINLEGLSTTITPAGPSGQVISVGDCIELSDAIAAVEMHGDYCPGQFTPLLDPNAPALCSLGTVTDAHLQDFESGLGSWTVFQIPTNPGTWENRDWVIESSLPGGRAGSGIYGPDPVIGDCASDFENGIIRLESPVVNVTGGSTEPIRMAFDHWVSIEDSWDGGNLKASVNGGSYAIVPGAAFTFNAYNGSLNTVGAGNDNPLAGEAAFTAANGGSVSGSWGQSQIDLSQIGVTAGDTVQFRYELGTDGCNGWAGWYVDDVRVYSCELVEIFSDGFESGDTTAWSLVFP